MNASLLFIFRSLYQVPSTKHMPPYPKNKTKNNTRWHWHSNDNTHIAMAKLYATIITRGFCTDIAIYPTVKMLYFGRKKCISLNKGFVLQFMEDTFRGHRAYNIQFSFQSYLLQPIKLHEMTMSFKLCQIGSSLNARPVLVL